MVYRINLRLKAQPLKSFQRDSHLSKYLEKNDEAPQLKMSVCPQSMVGSHYLTAVKELLWMQSVAEVQQRNVQVGPWSFISGVFSHGVDVVFVQ